MRSAPLLLLALVLSASSVAAQTVNPVPQAPPAAAVAAARATDGDDLQHPLRHRQGRRERVVGAARHALRGDSRHQAGSPRPAGGPRLPDRRDPRRRQRLRRRRRGPRRWRGEGRVLGDPVPDRALSRRRGGHVLVLRHAGGARVEVVGQPDHADLVLGAVHRSRRPGVLSLQPAPRPPVAAVARAQHGAAARTDRHERPSRIPSSSPATSTSARPIRRWPR